MTINFNTTPYFDDFNESKNFLRVLFRPGYAVQARELTQLQTSIQNQINKFGSHVFKNGSLVLNGETNLYYSTYIDVVVENDTNISQLENTIITGQASGAVAKTSTVKIISNSVARVYFLYTSSSVFTQGENVLTLNNNLFQIINDLSFSGQDQLFSINESVFFVNGHFVFCEKQIISINYTHARIGLSIKELVVTVDDDATLLDPAQGSYNYAAPGADRFTISLDLTSFSYDPSVTIEDSGNFIELAQVEYGRLMSRVTSASYSNLDVNLARRTYDESGDYTVKAFGLSIKPHVGTDDNKLSLAVGPGKAYIKGFEFETISTQYLDINKARELALIDSTILDIDFGSYIYISTPVNAHLLNYNNYPSVALYSETGGAGEILGTATISYFVYHVPNVYKLGLLNVSLLSNASFNDVKSIKNGSWVANIALNAYTDNGSLLISSFSKTHIVKLPNSPAHTLLTRENSTSDTEYQAYRLFTNVSFVPTDAGEFSGSYEATINTENDENFVSSNPNDFLIINTNGSIIIPSFVTGSNTSRTLLINQQLTGVKVYTRVGITHARQKNKSLSFGQKNGVSIRNISTGVLLTDKILLDVSDCYKLIKVTAKSTNTDATLDVTSYYVFNNGQKDEFYDHGWIQLKSGYTIPGVYDIVDIEFQYFSHSSPDGFFSVDSYNLNEIPYENIPSYTSTKGDYFNLNSCIDFRPVRTSGSGSVSFNGNYTIIPNTTLSVEYDYYLPRIDKLVLTKERKFYVVKGISADQPKAPSDLIDAMTLYVINLPAYTANEQSVSYTYIDNKRFTMRDISKIEKRVGRLEYYTTLSYLEKQAKDEIIPSDTPGIERFKNGILVDSFAGHSVGNPGNPDYKCSIDKENQILRPKFSSHSFKYNKIPSEITTDILTREKDLVHLKYNQNVFMENPYATTWVNVNPYMVFQWNGIVTLDPATDNWVDTQTAPDVVINVNGDNDVFTILTEDVNGVVWNDWETTIKGKFSALSDVNDNYTVTSNQPSIYTDPNTGGQTVTNSSYITNSQTKTTTSVDIESGIKVLQSKTNVITNEVGTKIVDTSIIPYVRSQVVNFSAKNLKPDTELFATLDGVNISAFCNYFSSMVVSGLTSVSLSKAERVRSGVTKNATVVFGTGDRCYFVYESSSTAAFKVNDLLSFFVDGLWITQGEVSSITMATGKLKTDSAGVCAGSFLIPDPKVPTNPKFRTGELIFRLSDTLSINSTTAAETKFVAQGLSQSVAREMVSTRVANVSIQPVFNLDTSTSSDTKDILTPPIVSQVQIPPPPEPITIHCDQSYFGDGRVGVWEYFIDFGEETSETSKVGIKIANTNGIPVRYTIIYAGLKDPISTGFIGTPIINGVNYNDILKRKGYPPIATNSRTRLEFFKLSNIRKALLKIETPIAGTNWGIEPFCVEPPAAIPTYSIQSDKLRVAEGGTVTFTVVTTDVAVGTKLWWVLDTTETRSISAADFSDGVAAGELTVNAAGVMVFTKTLLSDFITNENEIFVLDLKLESQTGTVVASSPMITVTDTSIPLDPTYEIQPDKTNVLEGDSVIFTVATTNVASGTTLKWEVDTTRSNTTSADFVATSGTITVLNNIAVFSVSIKEDDTLNEKEYFVVKLMLVDNTVIDYSPRIKILDSTDEPTFSITPNLRRVNEGNTVDFNIVVTGVNVATTRLYWKTSSDSTVESVDFTDNALSGGPIVLQGNSQFATAVLSRVTVEDLSDNEGTEYFGIDIFTDSNFTQLKAKSSIVTIIDTSVKLLPTYSIVPQLPPGLKVDEGGAIPYLVSTTNVNNGTTLYWRAIVNGTDPRTTAEAADFQYNTVSGSIVINNNNSGFGLQTITDELKEGNETVTVYLYTDLNFTNKVASAATVTIVDGIIPPPVYVCAASLSEIGTIDVGNRFLKIGHGSNYVKKLTISESINFGSPVRASWNGFKNGLPISNNVKYQLSSIQVTEETATGGYPPVSPPRIKIFKETQVEKYKHTWSQVPDSYRSIGPINEIQWELYPPGELSQDPPLWKVRGPNEEISLYMVFNPYVNTYSHNKNTEANKPPYNVTDNPINFIITTTWTYYSGDDSLRSSSFNTLTISRQGKFKAGSGAYYIDPVAQTFFVDGPPEGIFIKSIDLFFRKKSSWSPVSVQLRPVVNGYPSQSILMPINGECTKFPDEVSISTDGSIATNFEFPNIIHLSPGEYSFVVLANTDEYEIFTSRIGEFTLTDPDQRVTTQPLLGSMFKSQNATAWTPIQEEDVKFKLYRCSFVTDQIGTVLLNSLTDSNSDIDYDVFYSGGEVLDFGEDTEILYAYKTSTDQNGTKVPDSLVNYQYETNIDLPNTKTLFANDGSSLQFQIKMSSINDHVTPVVDLDRLSNVLVKNIINNDYTNETLAFGGHAYAKYITRAVKLNSGFDSQDLKVFFSAKIPKECEVKVYYKISSVDDTLFDDNEYTEMVLESASTWRENQYSEYKYKTPFTTADIISNTGRVQNISGDYPLWTAVVTELDSTSRLTVGKEFFATDVPDPLGQIVSITITNGGSGYITAPLVTISAPAVGTQATAEVIIDGGVVTAINITNPGSGYTDEDTIVVTFDSGTAAATAISDYDIHYGGSLGSGGTYVVNRIINNSSIEYSASGGTSPLPGLISDVRLALTTADAPSMAFANGDRFDTFSIKLVMLSDSSVKVPLIKDLRVIALDD